jgi:serine/threonine protein kinase
MSYGTCPDCKKPNTGYAWCNKCDPGKFLKEGKTSGNSEIDNFIYESQLKVKRYEDNLEWIPYDRLQDIKPIGEGGFANIYSATWLDGEPIKYSYIRERSEPVTVALKKLKSSENKMEAFINEVNFFNFNLIYCVYYFINYFVYQCKILHNCRDDSMFSHCFIKLYGITKDPQTEEFIMVLQFAEYGNLRNYLKNNINNLNWKEKLNILRGIALNLQNIHNENYVHKDLHSGNILQFNYNTRLEDLDENTKITDLGQAQIINNSKNSNTTNVCGVLPYIAPEVLDGKPYTKASDIYSFGIIMVEVST